MSSRGRHRAPVEKEMQAAENAAVTRPSAFSDASTALCEHVLKKGFQSRLFSDITLCFMGKDYMLHKIILSQSSYFCSLLSGPWKENGKPRIELQIDDPDVTVEGLECALAYMYGLSPVFTVDNVSSILATGCFLCLEDLCQNSVRFALQDLKVDTFVRYEHLSEKHCYGKFADSIRIACWSLLCSHAYRKLLHHLPKLSLQMLCHLLKSDELWVPNEAERYKLAKQALIEWKLARIGSADASVTGSVSRKTKGKSARGKSTLACRNLKLKNAQRATRANSKDRSSMKKDVAALGPEQKNTLTKQLKEGGETDLRKLRRLWEEDSGEQVDGCKDGFKKCTELFTGGGIIFAHMEEDDVLQFKKELEDADLPPDAANDSIWHNVLLKAHILKFPKIRGFVDSSSHDDDENDEDEDDDESSESDTDDSDGWSTDRSSREDESNSSEDKCKDPGSTSPNKQQNSSLVCFTCFETSSVDDIEPQKRKTTGCFTWTAKPDIGMQLSNFPPFRFGAEFVMKDNSWEPCPDLKCRELFYGGSRWKVEVLKNSDRDYMFCQLRVLKGGIYQDPRKKVRFLAKLYVKTMSGLRYVTIKGLRGTDYHCPSRKAACMQLARKDVAEDEPLRVSVVVQLVD